MLDMGGEIEDPHYWPEEAIEGLRDFKKQADWSDSRGNTGCDA